MRGCGGGGKAAILNPFGMKRMFGKKARVGKGGGVSIEGSSWTVLAGIGVGRGTFELLRRLPEGRNERRDYEEVVDRWEKEEHSWKFKDRLAI